jgi:dTDP-glucose pyrophosphorylase
MGAHEQVWRKAVLPPTATIGEAIRNLNDAGCRIILVLAQEGALVGTISDGDIRRGLLKGFSLDSPIANIVHLNALVVPAQMNSDLVMQLMVANKIQQVPVVDDNHHVIGLHLWDEIAITPSRENLMVIMAGGKGIRMRPHTENCPKPLLEVAGKSMLEHIIERAKLGGFTNFIIAIHYLGHMIEDSFGDGRRLGVRIDYLREDAPLGTAGALSLLNPVPELPFIVTNGDIVTDIRYNELLDFHNQHNAVATMAVRSYEWQHPFGVVQTQGIEITGIEEKPISRNYINAGVYVLEPSILNFIRKGASCDMPTLFEGLHQNNQRIIAYPMHEPWLDVGRPDDLSKINHNN